jgi:UDP-glucose 4-epimerase
MTTRANQRWLFIGGAGYIGAHIADEFLGSGKDVVIYDSLYKGLESRVEYLRQKHAKEIPLIVEDIRNLEVFNEVFDKYDIYGIVHCAALKAVAESMEKPDEYMEVNHLGTKQILEVASKYGVKNFIFSSTAAVYGSPEHFNSIKESDDKNPISPYGLSKLLAEAEVEKFLAEAGNHGTSLRFFNVVGKSAEELADNSVDNLVPIVVNKFNAGEAPVVFGTDYPTPDGSCIRDYVDVRDIARAHLMCADSNERLPLAMNVGTGSGYSVYEVIDSVHKSMGLSTMLEVIESGRRDGDPAYLCADVSLIEEVLGFKAEYSL